MQQGPVTVQQCTNRDAERVIPFFLLPAKEGCSEIKIAGEAGQGYEVNTVCETEGRVRRMQVKLSGDPQAMYSGTYSFAYPKSPQSNVGPVAFQGRRLGDCRPGQQPGEMVLPNGITVHPVDDARRALGHHHH
ncbi:hypothetical protein WQ53_04740 [Pseudoxanthomonas suwonensis]|uniref:Uncharacterized protein n=2 Tax=Pseudoxanthomonas suwonensis TaxID=314722 RepID=A0A0E3Z2G2_9GAMM|nr:hypothetical protein WQ53_04740 [Pseudoxanthomonas suwonensis]